MEAFLKEAWEVGGPTLLILVGSGFFLWRIWKDVWPYWKGRDERREIHRHDLERLQMQAQADMRSEIVRVGEKIADAVSHLKSHVQAVADKVDVDIKAAAREWKEDRHEFANRVQTTTGTFFDKLDSTREEMVGVVTDARREIIRKLDHLPDSQDLEESPPP